MKYRLMEKLPKWMGMAKFMKPKEGRLGTYNGIFEKDEDGVYRNEAGTPYTKQLEACPVEDAVLVSSKGPDGMHWCMFDIDMPVQVIPSSTEGKNHVYIDKLITEEQMEKLLKVMVEVGLVNEGVYDLQWRIDKELTLRPPWVEKDDDRSYNELSPTEKDWVLSGKKLSELPPEKYFWPQASWNLGDLTNSNSVW